MRIAKKHIEQLNNQGFTLLEVIIAVIVLMIVTIPFLHAFVTSANTNAKSKVRLRATNAAENVMEDIQNLPVYVVDKDGNVSPDCIVGKYGTSGVTYPNVTAVGESTPTIYSMDITNVVDSDGKPVYKETLPSGYSMTLTLDPTYYPNSNSLNVADFATVNDETSAVYCMPENFDATYYKEYEAANKAMVDAGTAANEWTAYAKDATSATPSFEEKLRREIRIDIEDKGETGENDENGDAIHKVKVDLSIYYCLDYDKIVPDGYKDTRRVVTRTLFNNSVSGKKLQSIFLLYNPRYAAAASSDNKAHAADVIVVNNPDGIVANLYVIAQQAEYTDEENKDASLRTVYKYTADNWAQYLKEDKGLALTLYENTNSKNGVDSSPLTLRTNLCEEPDYYYDKSTADSYTAKNILCHVKIDKPSNAGSKETGDIASGRRFSKGKYKDNDLIKTLDAANVSGKKLDASDVQNRIYDVSVVVTSTEEKTLEQSGKNGVETVTNRETIVELSGTKLDN